MGRKDGEEESSSGPSGIDSLPDSDPFLYRLRTAEIPAFVFLSFRRRRSPLSLPNVTAPFPANRTTDCRRNRNRRDQRVKIRFSQETFHNSVAQHESLDLLNSFDRFDRKFRIRAWPCIDAPMRRKKRERERETAYNGGKVSPGK